MAAKKKLDYTEILVTRGVISPEQLAEALADENIFTWNGNFYAVSLSERLGVEPTGGLLRIGLVHYNTLEEIDRCMRVLEQV